jgi:FkbM family methyltransferase
MIKALKFKLFLIRNGIKYDHNYYFRRYSGLRIYSNHYRSLINLFNQIFKRKLYDFDADTDTPFIIDAGANIGLATLFWKSKYPNASILCFEPSKSVFNSLKRNIVLNGLSNVTIIDKALYYQEGIIEFNTNERLSGSINLDKQLVEKYIVQTIKLSNHLNQQVDLLKLDIEGAELEVLKESVHKLHLVKRLFVEYHSFVDRKQELEELLSILGKNGFRYYLETEFFNSSPFLKIKSSLSQDFNLNIWAYRV